MTSERKVRFRIRGTLQIRILDHEDREERTVPVTRFMSVTNGERNWVVTPERATTFNNITQAGSLAFRVRLEHPTADVVVEQYVERRPGT